LLPAIEAPEQEHGEVYSVMTEATYVAFVPRGLNNRLRSVLQTEDTGPISWRERRVLFGSEFYFSGPPRLARTTHAYVSEWVVGR
jgi:hypothetical protein